jgi:hypothetical protein
MTEITGIVGMDEEMLATCNNCGKRVYPDDKGHWDCICGHAVVSGIDLDGTYEDCTIPCNECEIYGNGCHGDINEALQEALCGDTIRTPSHYLQGSIEVIDFIEDQDLKFTLANAVKYICRARHKGKYVEDLEKARYYLEREIEFHNAT